jgi:colicin import membrane protein
VTAAVFEERSDPGGAASALMSAAVHLLLVAVLVFGVRWQNHPPEAIAVELWEPPPAPVAEAPAPPPPPAPVEVKPEPVPPKPEIAEKAPEKPKPVPKPLPKVEPKPVPKPAPKAEPKPRPEPPKAAVKPRDEEAQRQIREQLLREQASLAVDRERQQIKDQLSREATAASSKAKAEWVDRVRAKIRGNIVLPPDLQGNPEAVFAVVQLPNGDVLSSKLVKSSGHRGYDEAVERAILKSSPLPRSERAEFFERELRLTFRPRD